MMSNSFMGITPLAIKPITTTHIAPVHAQHHAPTSSILADYTLESTSIVYESQHKESHEQMQPQLHPVLILSVTQVSTPLTIPQDSYIVEMHYTIPDPMHNETSVLGAHLEVVST
jgi:hypothetical protein